MLSSIHPLGERARHNRWAVTAGAFTLGALATAALVGAALGSLGALLGLGRLEVAARLLVAGLPALAAGAADLARVPVPGPHRQVNETWIGAYRGWVYGGAFGAQLGLGVTTFVVTWTVYATFALGLLTAHPLGGAVVGAAFGLGRALPVLSAARVDRPSRLTSFNQRLLRLGPPVRVAAAAAAALAGIGAVVAGSVVA